MTSRGVSFERVLDFFDNAPLRVAQAAVSQGLTIVSEREKRAERASRSQHAVVERNAKPARVRRTKAEIAAAATRVLSPAEHTAMTASTKAIKENTEVAQTLADA